MGDLFQVSGVNTQRIAALVVYLFTPFQQPAKKQVRDSVWAKYQRVLELELHVAVHAIATTPSCSPPNPTLFIFCRRATSQHSSDGIPLPKTKASARRGFTTGWAIG